MSKVIASFVAVKHLVNQLLGFCSNANSDIFREV